MRGLCFASESLCQVKESLFTCRSPCLPVHVPWVCLAMEAGSQLCCQGCHPTAVTPSLSLRAGGGGQLSLAGMSLPTLGGQAQDEFKKQPAGATLKWRPLDSQAVPSCQAGWHKVGCLQGGSMAIPALGDALGTHGSCLPLPQRFAQLQHVALQRVPSLLTLSLAAEKSNTQLGTHFAF